MAASTFDFIICGGGTSGCVIASRIVSQTTASVLLVEAGRDADMAPDVLIPGKYVHQLSADPEGLWSMPTVPQKELNNRELLFLRGKQLGGSSAVNYMALARGPAADYDEWARLVGDEAWKWENILPSMKALEDFRPQPPQGFEDFAEPKPSNHGTGGPLKVGFGDFMTPGVETFFKACQEIGMPVCLDNNSGNPVGVGLAQFNTGGGIRSYAANAFLDNDFRQRHQNLTVLTTTATDRILFGGNKAIGVELFDQSTTSTRQVYARQEVILCEGTFGSPRTLMLSGVGPESHLTDVGIECIANLPAVGQNMLDHSILTIEYLAKSSVPDHNQIFTNPALLAKADAMYEENKTGPHNIFGTSGSVAFPKINRLTQSAEFQQLDNKTRQFILEASRPSAEIWLGSGPSAYAGHVDANDSYLTHELLLQNNLSRGIVTLQSADPRALPLIDPHFLEHPYDRRIAIETVREAMLLGTANAYRADIRQMVHGPAGDDDESILGFVRNNLGQGYHSLGTCKMGLPEDDSRVVDNRFKVDGFQGLRVADLSVCPILTCNHTQINAYLIGERCAQLLVEDFQSQESSLMSRL